MPSKTPPRSFRPGPARGALIDAWAAKHRMEPHKAILALIDAGLGVNPAAARQVSEQIGQLKRIPTPKARWSLAAAGVQVGPGPYVPQPKKAKK